MSERDELIEVVLPVLEKCFDSDWNMTYSEMVTDALISAGYRKPRTITTAEELDALPEGTSILDQAEKLTLEETSMECLEWVDRHGNACWVELPATVLHEGEAKP